MIKIKFKKYSEMGALLMMLSVVLGAMAAHSLKNSLPDYNLHIFEKGVKYQFIHAFGLLALPLITVLNESKNIQWVYMLQLLGIFLFSGSLYFLALRPLMGLDHIRWIGILTPLGGISFVISWFLLYLKIRKL